MKHLFGLLTYACCLAMLFPLLFPSLNLLFLAPFLVICFYRCSLPACLWWGLICGFIIDLFSSQTRLGTYALNYCLVILCLYRYKFHFFEDRLSTFPLLTFCFTCLSVVIQLALFYVIGKPFSLSWEWIKSDLFSIPFQNALYALLAFTFPSLIFSHLKRRYVLFQLTKRRKI